MSNFKPSNNRSYLFLSLSGIGNFLMHSPTFATLKQNQPNSHLTVWVAPRNTFSLAKANPYVDQVIKAPLKRRSLGHLKQIIRLRHQHFTAGVMLYPGQLWKGALYLQLSGVPLRVGHRYPHLGNPDSSLFLTSAQPVNPHLHDIEQNLSLLTAFDITPPTTHPNYSLTIPVRHQTQAAKLIGSLHLEPNHQLVGFHPGSAPDFHWKRWPISHFTTLGKHLIKKHQAHILIFGGPAENRLMKSLRNALGKHHTSIISTKLLTAAAVIAQCKLFISNDSGLMHIAAALAVPTLGLFGPTDEKRTGPRGKQSYALRAPGTTPVYDVNTNYYPGIDSFSPSSDQSDQNINTAHPSLVQLKPSLVIDKIHALLAEDR